MCDELLHYGVKGMKWGVRRSIGKKARQYVYAGTKRNMISKKIERQERKSNLSDRQKRKLNKNITKKKNLEKTMNTLIKDVKPDDVKQAKVDLAVRSVGAYSIGGLIGMGLYKSSLSNSLRKYM